MPFQSTVYNQMGMGVVGEVAYEGPSRAQPYTLVSDDAAYNVFGRLFTVVSAGVAKAGGTGPLAGILINPKESASRGTSAGGSLAPTLTLANYEIGSLTRMNEVFVAVPAAASIGDQVTYDTTNGVIATRTPTITFTGEIAVTTGVLTATAIGADEYLAPGTVLTGTGIPAGTIVTAQLTGTAGKNGTYQTNIVTAVASTTMTAPNSPLVNGSTYADVPNCTVSHYAPSGAGLAVVTITN